MLDVRTYTWKDVKNTEIVINSTGTTAKLSEFANSSKTDPIVALESVLKLYGFTNIQINNPTGRNIIFSYDSKYNFLIIQLQNLTINMNVDILNGVIYWKPFQGAVTTDYKTWDITNGSLKKTFSTNGEEIYLGYVAEAMSEGSAYLWNNGKDILNQLITPLELVEAIGEGNLNEQSSFTSDIVDSYGDTIEYEYLNQIASYHTIPRYYLGNKSKSFKGISFDYNVSTFSDNTDNQGQYIFNDNIQYKGGSKKDTKYWSFSPGIYPIVVFNTLTQYDTSSYKPISHKITYTNETLTVDSTVFRLQENDQVVLYKRGAGNWVADNDTFIAGRLSEGKDDDEHGETKDGFDGTGTLTCNPISTYILDTGTVDFNCLESSWSNFKNITLTTKDTYQKVIKTHPNITVTLPTLSGHDHASSGAYISTIGDYSWDTNFWGNITNISNKSDLTITMTATVTNLQTLYDLDSVSCIDTIDTDSTTAYVFALNNYMHTNIYSAFYRKMLSWAGTFPAVLALTKDGTYYKNSWNNDGFNYRGTAGENMTTDASKGTLCYNEWEKGYIITEGSSISIDRNNNFTLFGLVSTPGVVIEDHKISTKENTYGLAIVVWRNGKLLD